MQMMMIGIIYLIIGILYKLFPPKKINHLYGWRTGFAMKNQQTWDAANRLGAKLFIYGGIIDMLAAYISGALFKHAGRYIFLPVTFGTIAVIWIFGEIRLRKLFDKNGSRVNKNKEF